MSVKGGELAGGTMGTWKAKTLGRTRKNVNTSGVSKGGYCVADATQKYMAKRSRSYKDSNYPAWVAWANRANKLGA